MQCFRIMELKCKKKNKSVRLIPNLSLFRFSTHLSRCLDPPTIYLPTLPSHSGELEAFLLYYTHVLCYPNDNKENFFATAVAAAAAAAVIKERIPQNAFNNTATP